MSNLQDFYRDVDQDFHDIEKDVPEDVAATAADDGHEYEDMPFYWIYKLLRGNTAGRRIKRAVFKFGVFQVVCGFSLMVITMQEQVTYSFEPTFTIPVYGASLLVSILLRGSKSIFYFYHECYLNLNLNPFLL
jgi:hypothetical protein